MILELFYLNGVISSLFGFLCFDQLKNQGADGSITCTWCTVKIGVGWYPLNSLNFHGLFRNKIFEQSLTYFANRERRICAGQFSLCSALVYGNLRMQVFLSCIQISFFCVWLWMQVVMLSVNHCFILIIKCLPIRDCCLSVGLHLIKSPKFKLCRCLLPKHWWAQVPTLHLMSSTRLVFITMMTLKKQQNGLMKTLKD